MEEIASDMQNNGFDEIRENNRAKSQEKKYLEKSVDKLSSQLKTKKEIRNEILRDLILSKKDSHKINMYDQVYFINVES